MTTTKKKSGRPEGAKTAERLTVDTVRTRCPSCGSTEREEYKDSPTYIQGDGTAPDGMPYSGVYLRKTKCLTCGQHRNDREYEYVPKR